MDIPNFETIKETIDFVVANKSAIAASKKMQTKCTDSTMYQPTIETLDTTKAADGSTDRNIINAKVAINTTNILDSHGDVHIDGIWNKTVKEQKNVYLLEEHVMSFRTIISDKVVASVQNVSWKELGVKAEGMTQALVFDAELKRDRNAYMFGEYEKGHVKNHSVGMRYSKLELAVNSIDYPKEKVIWDKHIDSIVNRKDAENLGHFWAVYEAKMIEGSAVPIGSNVATPTLSTEIKNIEPSADTHVKEPLQDTQTNTTVPKDGKQYFINLLIK